VDGAYRLECEPGFWLHEPIFYAHVAGAQQGADGAFRATYWRGDLVSDAGPCGLFVPSLPLTYAISLIQGIWQGEAWSAHMGDVAALVVVFAVCTAQPTLGDHEQSENGMRVWSAASVNHAMRYGCSAKPPT
jgi:hypothetical protein